MNLFLKITSVLLFLGSMLILIKNPSTESFIMFFICAIVMFAYVYDKKISSYNSKKSKELILAKKCVITEYSFYFPKGYYFKHGLLKNKKELLFSEVDAIWINTFPLSAIVNKKEVVFLRGINKEDLDHIKGLENVPFVDIQDNWSLIAEEYLDTEFDQKYKEQILTMLINVGFTLQDIKKIKKKIAWRMYLLTYFSLEWIHYGHYDVLTQFPFLDEKTYWWTMEIALKTKPLAVG